MKQIVLSFLILLTVFAGCKQKDGTANSQKEVELTSNIEVALPPDIPFPIYDYDGIEPILNKKDDKTYIVNFWATWCKPCLEELPSFEKTYEEQKENNVELILVSLDMPSMWEKRLVPYVDNNSLQGEVIILDDPKMNEWIPKINEDWGGGIPATLIYNKDKRIFYGKGMTYEELNTELEKFL